MRRLVHLAALGLVAATGVAGCRSDDAPPPPEPDLVVAGDRYVALGDSYTAAPGIGGTEALDGLDGCFRSVDNYPHLVANAIGLELHDVSCGGASTESITRAQTTIAGKKVPPQLAALGPGTDLVTVRIGGNDFGLFGLITHACPQLAADDPHGHPCLTESRRSDRDLEDLLGVVRHRVTATLRKIVGKAPNAVVLVVGYPSIVPEHGTCSNLPLATGDYSLARTINTGYNDALQAAAEATDTTYVDVYRATLGHDICGKPPWIAGARSRNSTAPWHPYAQEQQKTADLIEAALQRD